MSVLGSFLPKNVSSYTTSLCIINSKRFRYFNVPAELDIRGRPNYWGLRRYKKEKINKEPLTEFIQHKRPDDWKLYRTTAPNPRQIWMVNEWQPLPGLRKLRGHTNGSLRAILEDLSCLWKWGPAKALSLQMHHSGGRYYTGRIHSRGRGGRCVPAKIYRCIDFNHEILDEEGIVERIEIDKLNRSCYIALIRYPISNRIQYKLAVDGLLPGDSVISTKSEAKYFKKGYAMPLKYIPNKASICFLEENPGKGQQCVRAAGTYAKILNKNGTRQGFALIELPSKELKLFDLECMATLGRVSNINHNKVNLGNAGRSRKLGNRPVVRGIAMNPCDHPHGGGTKKKRTRPFHGGELRTFKGEHQFGFRTRLRWRMKVPVEMQRILKRRPRHFKPGQLF